MNKIKNLIIDFGGVLYDIDIQRTISALQDLQIPVNYDLNEQNNLFFRLEKGEISNDHFLSTLKNASPLLPNIESIEHAFMQILVGMNLEHYRYLRRLCKSYSCFLLSNTNDIHYRHFSREITQSELFKDFSSSFVKEYYSFQMGMRKPDTEIFEYIINNAGIVAEESLFIDDDPHNISSARKIGLNCFNFAVEGKWNDLIEKYNLII